MNSEIEQRIVAMYFDNKDFEKNAKQTIDTLGELKENLNLEDSVKGFDELDKAGKKLNLNQARNTINRLKESTSGLSEGLKKAFNIGTAPLHALDNFFETFRGYVGKFLGFDLASKFVGSLESALRQLTVAPIEAGWSMYQANVDSVKTIMSGTLKSYKEEMSETNADWTYDEAEHMEYVKEQLAELSSYAQKTVFSLSDMTSNVGKFTNNNIPLEESVIAMEGIANMAAKAGQGADKASMAMYNFSQAIGVGKMTSIDWKSIENANMATTELKDLFIETAAAAGKLQKEVTTTADGKKLEKFFITVDKNGKKLAKNKWIEVSAENFRDSLSNGWLDKETMLRVMQIYSNKNMDLDTLAAWGFDINDEELVKSLFEIGAEAEKAATQVRTFSKMWDAMTEAVQSGWADSMQYIFGDMLEATDFWTTVNEKIGSVLDNASERRNNILREWRGLTFNEETGEWERLEGAIDGREDLIQGIYGVIDAAKSLGSAFSGAWSDVFGNMTGAKLQEITKGFRDFIDRFKTWLGNMDDANSRLSKIRKGVSGVFSILKLGVNILKAVFNIGIKIIKPLIDPLLNLFSKFGEKLNLTGAKNLGEMLKTLRDRFTALWSKLSEMGISGIFAKIGEKLSGLWESIKKGIGDFLDENGLSGVKEWFIQLGDKIKEGYETVKTWWEGSGIPEFFAGIWEAVSGLFKQKETTRYNGSMLETTYEDAPIVTFFKGLGNKIQEAYGSLKSWWEGSGIPEFFANIWEAVTGLFKPKETTRYNGSMLETTYEDAPIVAFFKGLVTSVQSAWNTVTAWEGWDAIGDFFAGVWEKVSGWFQPKEHTRYNGSMLETTYEDAPIVAFFKGLVASVQSAWNTVTAWEGWDAIGDFFADIWEKVSGWFKPEEVTRYNGSMLETTYKDAPIVAFFKNIYNGIVTAWEKLKGWEGWAEIGKFFSDVWGWIENVFNGDNGVAETVEKATTIGATSGTSEGEVKDTEKSVGFIERIVGVISDFITKIMGAVDGVAIPPELTAFFVNLGDVFKAMFGFVTKILGHLKNMLNGQGSAEEWIVTGLGALLAIIGAIFSYQNNKHLASIQTESIATKFMALGVGMLAIASALALLTTIDQDKMWKAAAALGGLMLIMALVVNQLTKKTAAQTALTTAVGQTPTERVITRLIGALEKVAMIYLVMDMLPGIINAFAEAKKIAPELEGDDIMAALTGVMLMISGISLALAATNKMTGGVGLDPRASVMTALSVLATMAILLTGFEAIVGLVGGIANLLGGKDNVDAVIQTLNDGAAILAAVGGAIGGFFAALFGGGTSEQKADQTTRVMEKLAEASEIFDTEKTAGITRMMTLIQTLSKQSESIDPSRLDGFSEAMSKLGSGIYEYVRFLTGDDYMQALSDLSDPNSDIYIRLMAFQDLGTKLSELFRAWGDTGWSMGTMFDRLKSLADENDPMSIQTLVGYLNKILTGLGDLDKPETGIQFDGVTIVEKLYSAIQDGLVDPKLPRFDATPVVDAIVDALLLGDAAIAQVVHSMVQNGMKLSGKDGEGNPFTVDDETSELLKSLLGGGEAGGLGKLEGLNGDFTKTLYGDDGNGGILGTWKGFQTEMEGIEFPDMSEKLSQSFSFKDPETGEDLDLSGKLKETLAGFEESLNENSEFEIKIVPTFDLSNLNEESLRTALGDYPVGLPLQFSMPDVLQIDFTGMAAELNMDDVRTRINQVTTAVDNSRIAMVDAITNMGVRIDNLGVSIRQLRLYLDTGALVGGIVPMIDKKLGERANWADGGATPIAIAIP